MQGTYKYKNPYDKSYRPVVLPSLSNEIYQDQNLEPQMMRIRASNNGKLYLSSKDDSLSATDPSDVILGYPTVGEHQRSIIFANKIDKFAVTNVVLYWGTPNVNPRNNEYTFHSTFSGNDHSVIVTPGFYKTPNDLMTAIINGLNSVTAQSGLTFSFSLDPLSDSIAGTLSAAGGNYYFIVDSFLKKSRYLWGPPLSQTPTNGKQFGAVQLQYTRFIDFASTKLESYAKMRSANSFNGENNIIFRLNLVDQIEPGVVRAATEEPRFINWDSTENMSAIDIRLYDEWGEQLYVPLYNDSETNLDWNMTILTES